jgi:hypothetical protein
VSEHGARISLTLEFDNRDKAFAAREQAAAMLERILLHSTIVSIDR